MEFLPNFSENFYEFMICQQNGQVRKISAVYSKQKSQSLDQFDNDLGDPQSHPLIIAKALLTKCGYINREKPYQAINLTSQTNYTMFNELGLYENRVFINLQEGDKIDEECRDVYSNHDDNQIGHLMSLDKVSNMNYCLIPV